MKNKSFVFNQNLTNTYVVSDIVSKEAIIIDCGCCSDKDFERLEKYITEEHLVIKHCICTHLHFDHVWGNNYVSSKYKINILANHLDNYNLEWNKMCSIYLGLNNKERELLNFDSYI